MELLEPIEKVFEMPDGKTKTFILSKFPAVTGREIITQYPTTAAPKVGDYNTNETLMLKLMTFVAIPIKDREPIRLTSLELINNHIPSWETLIKIEWAMMQYNSSFLANGKIFDFLALMQVKGSEFLLKTLTSFVQSLSEQNKPPSGN